MPGTPFAPIPYFEGPSDAGELRNYLNQLVREINAMRAGWLGHSYRFVSASGPILDSDEWIEVDASGGAVTLLLPAVDDVATQQFTINKSDGSGNSVTVWDGGSYSESLPLRGTIVTGSNGAVYETLDIFT